MTQTVLLVTRNCALSLSNLDQETFQSDLCFLWFASIPPD